MPTVLRWNGYWLYFVSNEGRQPPHIHVDKARKPSAAGHVMHWPDIDEDLSVAGLLRTVS